jgi:hypothetical protein
MNIIALSDIVNAYFFYKYRYMVFINDSQLFLAI